MNILEIVQGTKEWLDVRRNFPTASEAAAMFGETDLMTRTELIKLKKFGSDKEVSDWVQKNLFDKGHAIEALARAIVEKQIGEDLFPVTATENVDGIDLLGSFDGLTMSEEIVWECKSWNEKLVEMVKNKDLSPKYYWQLEQLLAISKAVKAIFTVSDGTEENTVSMEYYPVSGRRERLVSGWKLFMSDMRDYVLPAISPEIMPAMIKELPAINYKLNGLILSSNLDVYKSAALQLVEDSKLPLENDQDFADREALCKKFKESEDKIKALQQQVIGEISDVDRFCKELSSISDMIRQARLNGEKMVTARKEAKRADILTQAKNNFDSFLMEINKELACVVLPHISVDFVGAIKGKKLFSSMIDAVETELSRGKLEANEVAGTIRKNMAYLDEIPDYSFLFADKQAICTKSFEDFKNLVNARINAHEIAVAEKMKADELRMQEEIAKQVEAARQEEIAKANQAAEKAKREADQAITDAAENAKREAEQANAAKTVNPITNERIESAPVMTGRKRVQTPTRDIFAEPEQKQRPSDGQIINAIAEKFNVDPVTALAWIKEVK